MRVAHAVRLTTVEKYLKFRQLKCPLCASEMSPIVLKQELKNYLGGIAELGNFYGENLFDGSHALVSMVRQTADPWQESSIASPGIYVVPTVCGSCGGIQKISLGHIQAFEEMVLGEHGHE